MKGERQLEKQFRGMDKVVEETKRKSPRELVSIDYGMMDANMDEEIFCHGCKQWVVPPCAGCGDCSMQFVHPDKLKLEVVRSKVMVADLRSKAMRYGNEVERYDREVEGLFYLARAGGGVLICLAAFTLTLRRAV